MKFFPLLRYLFGGLLPSLAVLACVSCTGQVSSSSPGDEIDHSDSSNGGHAGSSPFDRGGSGFDVPVSAQSECKSPRAVPLALRRLTPYEYANTMKSLLAVDVDVDKLLSDPKELGFEGFAKNQVASTALSEQWDAVAESVADKATRDLSKLLGCDPATNTKCWSTFVSTFGARAYRRPLNTGELNKHILFLQNAQKAEGVAGAAKMYIVAILQSPSFLYRPETLASENVGPQRLDEWAIASRLSYLLWQTMPDQTLFDAARSKQLGSATDLRTQVTRMLTDPKAASAVRHFAEQWLEVDSLSTLSKDESTYPDFIPKVGLLMKEELGRFVEAAVLGQGNGVAALFSSKQTFVNTELAKFYGWPGPSSGELFSAVSMPDRERQGLLTLGGVMAVHGRPNQSSPIARGKFVRERILCQTLPSPPNDIDITAPIVRAGATTRERFTDHKSDPRCAGCHALIDPVGFLFEHYDGVGRYRTKDQGRDVDASGELSDAEGIEGKYTDVLSLVPKLTQSRLVSSCMTIQWFRFAFGREPSEQDTCTMFQLADSLERTQGNMKEMLVALVMSPSFLTAIVPQGVSP